MTVKLIIAHANYLLLSLGLKDSDLNDTTLGAQHRPTLVIWPVSWSKKRSIIWHFDLKKHLFDELQCILKLRMNGISYGLSMDLDAFVNASKK